VKNFVYCSSVYSKKKTALLSIFPVASKWEISYISYEMKDRGIVRFPAGIRGFLFSKASGSAVEPTQLPWVRGAVSLHIKRSGREADQSPISSTEVKNGLRCSSTTPYLFYGMVVHGAQGELHVYVYLVPYGTRVHSSMRFEDHD
jgi:hypothetical protein